MQYRIGSQQMRTFLHDTCYVAPEDMTPKPSTITTTQATTTTATVSRPTTTTEQVRSTTNDLLGIITIIQTSVQQEFLKQQQRTLLNALLESTTSSPTTTGLSKKQQHAQNAKLRTLEGLQPQTVSDDSKYDAEIAKEKSYIKFEIEHSQENSSLGRRDTDCSNIANRDSIKCRGITNSSHRGSVTSSVLILVAMVTVFINLC